MHGQRFLCFRNPRVLLWNISSVTIQISSTRGRQTRLLCRPRPMYLPLIYRWSVHLLSAIEFAHSHEVILGSFDMSNYWLSAPSLSLSKVGFVWASFHLGQYPCRFPSNVSCFTPFHPKVGGGGKYVRPTVGSDMFLSGTAVYQLMTTLLPGDGYGGGPDVGKEGNAAPH